MSLELDTVLNNATVYFKKVHGYMQGKPIEGSLLTKIIAAHLLIAMEHHESIVLLANKSKWMSAFALGRPAYEISIKATWLALLENENSVQKALRGLKRNKDRFPTLEDMSIEIDKALEIKLLQNERAIRRLLNSSVHGGSFMIVRCMTNDKVTPQVAEEEIIALVRATTQNLLLAALALAHHTSDESLAKGIIADITDYEG